MVTTICPATSKDLQSINDIYNHYVRHTHITFDVELWTLVQRQQWFSQFSEDRYTLLVAKQQEQVVGFSYTSAFRPKQAYQQSAEVTIYTDTSLAPKGTGSNLYNALIDSAQQFHRLYAVIALPNLASLKLHQAFGFICVGKLNEVGYKFGKYHTVKLLEKRLLNSYP